MATEDEWNAFGAARAAFRDGDAAQAIELMRGHPEFVAKRPNVARAVARFEIEGGDFARALALLAPLEDEAGKTAKLRIEAYAGLRDWDAIRKLAQGLPEDAYSHDPKMCFAIAKAASMNLEADFAIKVVRMGLAHRPKHPQMIKILYGMICAKTPPKDLAQAIEDEAFADGQESAQVIGIEVALRHGGLQMKDFFALYEKAKTRWPDAAELALCEAWVAPSLITSTEGKDQLDVIREQLRHEAKTNHHIGAAVATFETFEKNRLTRDIIPQGVERGMLASEKGPENHVILNFCGLGRQGGRDEMFDAYYSAMGATSIFLNDADQLMFLDGIRTVADGFDATVECLRAEIDRIAPGARITVVGPSGGGFGALAFGALLNADRIICFSSATVAIKSRADEIGDHRARAVAARIYQTVPHARQDMLSLVKSSGYAGRIDMLYGDQNDVDRGHAENMAPLPNVTLYPIKGFAQHSSILHAVACGAFEDIIRGDMSAVEAMTVR